MTRTPIRTCRALLAVAALACASGCRSSAAAPDTGGAGGRGGSSGTGGAEAGGGACAPTAGAPSLDTQGCPNAYFLPRYDGGLCALCDPGVSTQCPSAGGCDFGATFSTECTPDGTACTSLSATSFCPGGPVECGWTSTPACPALGKAVAQQEAGAAPCASEADCAQGAHCSVRVANRMFCTGAVFVHARDYCPDGGADAGMDASGAGADASDASADAGAADAGPG